jgi:4-hydroxythreonine-4-phosphate dehydrogenase
MSEREKAIPKVGISLGDFNGVGPEIILKCIADNRILQYYTPVIFGSPRVFSFYKKMFELNDVNLNYCKSADQIHPKKLNLWVCWEEETPIKPGAADPIAGSYALKALDAAIDAYKQNMIDVLVTAPLDKHTVSTSDNIFTGHTGHIAKAFGAEPLMILAAEKLKVALVTGHIPINKVSENITKEKLTFCIQTLNKSLQKDFKINKPKIAVLGLNPHAGENGIIGKEETEIIAPLCEELMAQKVVAMGPYPADGFFASQQYQKFDAVLAMYHDQGLIPFKSMAFEDGVNFTAGLPIIRTSPDHGTAYDIAGKGIASHESMQHAIFSAIKIYKNRNEFEQITENPLKFSMLKRERFRMEF